ncbi:MAG: hypothetical protein KA781_10195 [Aquabacterium sp.]|nr:hypothetical protein [Aquabacterium sp.]
MNTKPTQHHPQPAVTVSRDLVLKLQVGDTEVSRKLSVDEAMGLIGILNFVVRECVHQASHLTPSDILSRKGH